MEMTLRVKQLREKIVNAMPEVCLERASLMTRSYRETEGEAQITRRAKSFHKILDEMSIGIDEGELIVGRATSKLRGGPLLPEIQWGWYLEEMDLLSTREWDRFAPLGDREKEEMRQFLPYWKGKALYDRWHAICPKEAVNLAGIAYGPPAFCTHNANLAHVGIDGTILSTGLNGVKKEVEEKIGRLNPARDADFEKILFLRAVKSSIDAVSSFAGRYSRLAEKLAGHETNERRKAELVRIADTCGRVPAQPARSFYEALQSLWFIYLGLMNEAWGYGIGFGRPDQYLFPFYEKDLREGRMTREEALELIELFYIKLNSLLTPQGSEAVQVFAGFAIWANIALGGITREGRSGVNELTYLFLDAEESVRLMSEDLIIRVHRSNPDDYLLRAVEALRTIKGKFKFVNDEITIQQLMKDGKPLERARDYVMAGCITPTIPGFSHDIPGAVFNLPLMLELALNDGVWRRTGERIGLPTGDPRRFESFDDLLKAYKRQLEHFFPMAVTLRNVDRRLYSQYCPTPFQSALYPRCIERGVDITSGGTVPYSSQAVMAMGAPNVADGLAAVKKAVFEEKRISMEELIHALERDFEGEEQILQILESCPKFGNDDDYVDSIICELLSHFSREAAKYESCFGVLGNAAALALTSNIPLGAIVGALPDGRRSGAPFADGGISPCQGRNTSGPTSTMRSVSKIDHAMLSGGCVLNMRFNPDALQTEGKRKKFAALIRTFFETGGSFVQFNIVDTETLRAAQRNPAAHKDLLVRVSTYSAYFVELSRELQEDIIARLEIQGI